MEKDNILINKSRDQAFKLFQKILKHEDEKLSILENNYKKKFKIKLFKGLTLISSLFILIGIVFVATPMPIIAPIVCVGAIFVTFLFDTLYEHADKKRDQLYNEITKTKKIIKEIKENISNISAEITLHEKPDNVLTVSKEKTNEIISEYSDIREQNKYNEGKAIKNFFPSAPLMEIENKNKRKRTEEPQGKRDIRPSSNKIAKTKFDNYDGKHGKENKFNKKMVAEYSPSAPPIEIENINKRKWAEEIRETSNVGASLNKISKPKLDNSGDKNGKENDINTDHKNKLRKKYFNIDKIPTYKNKR